MPKERKKPSLKHYIAEELARLQGKKPRLLPPHQRAKPERSREFFQQRQVLKAERRNLILHAHEQKKTGRPLEYQGKAHDDMLLDMRLLGSTKEQIAAAMFIDVATITRWLNDHATFNAAWEAGGDHADSAVLRKMYQKAMGYRIPTMKVFYDSKSGEVIEHEIVEEYPPDQKAAEFILTNRQRGNWRHRQDSSLVDNDGNTLQPPPMVILPVAAPKRDG